MKAILVIQYEQNMEEIVRILAENNYTVIVKKAEYPQAYYWEHKYQIEVNDNESNSSD